MAKFDPKISEIMAPLVEYFGERNVILAGGAVRDCILGADVKDYDVWIKFDSGHYHDEVKALQAALIGEGVIPVLRKKSPLEYDDEMEVFASPFVLSNGNEVDVDFIMLPHDPREMIEKFDFDICQAYLDFSADAVITTSAFEYALAANLVRYVLPRVKGKNPKNLETVLKHAKRIAKKYPRFDFHTPTPKSKGTLCHVTNKEMLRF